MSRLTAATTMTFENGITVSVTPRANSLHLRLRRTSDGRLLASVPRGADEKTVRKAIAGLLPRLRNTLGPSTAQRYRFGWTCVIPEGRIAIISSDSRNHPAISRTDTGFCISLPPDTDFSDPSTAKAVSDSLIAIARHLAPRLIPFAEARAAELGIQPLRWEIGKGRGVLGCCYRNSRRIRLSALLIFLPPELRTFIIDHELAHLTHPDHSPAFHSLCDTYCRGNEKRLITRLRKFPWPILR